MSKIATFLLAVIVIGEWFASWAKKLVISLQKASDFFWDSWLLTGTSIVVLLGTTSYCYDRTYSVQTDSQLYPYCLAISAVMLGVMCLNFVRLALHPKHNVLETN